MKKYLLLIVLFSSLLIFLFNIRHNAPDFNSLHPELYNWLQENYIPIVTIDPNNNNFDDLSFLEDILKDVDLIMLGEQQHGDGAAFRAKSRFIQFLHQKLGFDVLLYEAGMYDCYSMSKYMREVDSVDVKLFGGGLWHFWSRPEEVKSLLNYLGKEVLLDNFDIGGVDFQLTGNKSNKSRKEEIIKTLTAKYNVSPSSYSKFLETFDKYSFKWEYTSERQDSILNEIKELVKVSSTNLYSEQDSMFHRYISNIYDDYFWKMKLKKSGIAGVNYRDSLMAENFIWLKNNFYKKKKIIVWAANSHILYGREELSRQDDIIPMGQYLKNKYKSKCYVLNLTSHWGTTLNIYTGEKNLINGSASSGFETTMHNERVKFGFFNFRNLSDSVLANKSFLLKCLGHSNNEGKWIQMTDGLLYIDEMTPITFKERR